MDSKVCGVDIRVGAHDSVAVVVWAVEIPHFDRGRHAPSDRLCVRARARACVCVCVCNRECLKTDSLQHNFIRVHVELCACVSVGV